MDTDHVRQEFLATGRRLLAAFLGLMLLVAFWADRPTAAASYPAPQTGAILRGEKSTRPEEPGGTAIISFFRKPWLMLYTAFGAPPLDRGALTEAEETRFRVVVGGLAVAFFTAAIYCWVYGRRLIDEARRASS